MSRFVSTVSGPPSKRPEGRPENTSTVNITTANGSSITITGSHIELEVQNLSPPNILPRRRPSVIRPKMEEVDGDDDAQTTVDWAENTNLSRRIENDKKQHPPSHHLADRHFGGGPGPFSPSESSAVSRSRVDIMRGGPPLARQPSRGDLGHNANSQAKDDIKSSQPTERLDSRHDAQGFQNDGSSGDGTRIEQVPQRTPGPTNLTPSHLGLGRPLIRQPQAASVQVIPTQHIVPFSEVQAPIQTMNVTSIPTYQPRDAEAERHSSMSGSFRRLSNRFCANSPDHIPPIVSTPPASRRANLNPSHHSSLHSTSEHGGDYFPVVLRPPSPFERLEVISGSVHSVSSPVPSLQQVRDSRTDGQSSVSTWRKAPLPPSEPAVASTVTSTPRAPISHVVEKQQPQIDESISTSTWRKAPLLQPEPFGASTGASTLHPYPSQSVEKQQSQRDEPSSVSTWRKASLPPSEPMYPSTVTSSTYVVPSHLVEKPSHHMAAPPTDTPSARSIWRSKMLPESDTQSNATFSIITTSIPVPIEYRVPPPRSTATIERSRPPTVISHQGSVSNTPRNRDKSPAPPSSTAQSNRTNAGAGTGGAGAGGMFALRAAMHQNNPFQNPGSVVSAPPATTFRPPPSATPRHAEPFNRDARDAVLSSQGGHGGMFGMNETARIAPSNGPVPDALSYGNVAPAVPPPPPAPQTHNQWRQPPSVPTSSQSKQAPSLLPTPTQSPSRVNGPKEDNSPNSLGLFGVGPPPSLHRSNSKVDKEGSIAPSTPPSTPRVIAMQSAPT